MRFLLGKSGSVSLCPRVISLRLKKMLRPQGHLFGAPVAVQYPQEAFHSLSVQAKLPQASCGILAFGPWSICLEVCAKIDFPG